MLTSINVENSIQGSSQVIHNVQPKNPKKFNANFFMDI